MWYYIIFCWIIGLFWFGKDAKHKPYPIMTTIIGALFSPIFIPIRLILKLLR